MDRVPVSRFGPLQSEDDIKQIKESRVPKNTWKNTCWALQVWEQWATEQLEKDSESISSNINEFLLEVDIRKMSNNYWLQRFVLEARKSNGEHYSPDSLHQLCCGLQRAIRAAGNTNINFFDSKLFVPFREVN